MNHTLLFLGFLACFSKKVSSIIRKIKTRSRLINYLPSMSLTADIELEHLMLD